MEGRNLCPADDTIRHRSELREALFILKYKQKQFVLEN
jgi:hypothetical protein